MSNAFDYNGFVVAPSAPKKVLRTVKKTIHIDSADRDVARYPTNGDWVAYLPRVYKNVVSIRLVEAMFPTVASVSYNPGPEIKHTPGVVLRSVAGGAPVDTALVSSGIVTSGFDIPYYFLVELNGLNKSDEGAIGANGSSIVDGYFAKIPIILADGGPASFYYTTGATPVAPTPTMIAYNDKTYNDNIGRYTPPIENLDRIQIRTRLHSQQGNRGYMYWTSNGTTTGSTTAPATQYSMTLEIEMLENGFDEFSSIETRVRQ